MEVGNTGSIVNLWQQIWIVVSHW